MYDNIFTLAGLSPEQAKIYELLIKNKGLGASQISLKTGIERTFAYKIINQLIEQGLAEKIDKKGEITKFFAKSPSRIKEMVDIKTENALKAQELINTELGHIISEFNLNARKPNITFMEGMEGLKKINDDIIKETYIKLIRSSLDKKRTESHVLIEDQIKKRVSLGIETKVIGPFPAGKETDINLLKRKDRERLVTRGVIEDLEIPAQIIIYGDKVAITDYKDEMITTIIENPNVRATFDRIFDFMYEKSKKLSEFN